MNATAKDWDATRTAFAASIMVDTPLNSLAQNLDAPDWPIKGKDETPAKYIDLTLEEAADLLKLKGQSPDRIDQLISILKETLAFDNPFGDMVAQAEEASARDNPLLKNLAKLGIPENFPITLSGLSEDTLEFCKLEKLATLGELGVFAQGMSQNLIVGGDFRMLLNSLSHIDEAAVARVLPFRPGTRGLHLVEAVAQATRAKDPAARTTAAVAWFKDDMAALVADLNAGGKLERHFVHFGDLALEARAVELLRPHLPALAGAEKKKAGLFARLFKK